jgi:CRP-like cAMP-binding protein
MRLSYISQLAACNRQHKIETRLARWLLLVGDCLKTNNLPLTQEFIANMLGTNRAGVTLAAQKLQNQDMIVYSRGSITVKDREQLESIACECYEVMGKESHRLFAELDKPSWQRC